MAIVPFTALENADPVKPIRGFLYLPEEVRDMLYCSIKRITFENACLP